jgi:hypothetical protein
VLLDRELYLHADWEKDPERCKTIPKPTLAKQMFVRAIAKGESKQHG